jgi:hypothetical protein
VYNHSEKLSGLQCETLYMDGGEFAWRLGEQDDDVRGRTCFCGVLPKQCVFVTNEGIFVNFCLKKACATHVGSLLFIRRSNWTEEGGL